MDAYERLTRAKAIVEGAAPPVHSQNPLQRPTFYYPDLSNRSQYDPDDFSWSRNLRASFGTVWQELRQALLERRGFEPIFPKHTDAGAWAGLWLHFYGQRFDDNCAAFPQTTSLILGIPRLAGWAMFSAMSPGSHVNAHCGVTNAKLRIHMALRVEDGCRMRVGTDWHEWKAGEVYIFDDSVEHEVWVCGTGPRIVFILDVYHPDLSDSEVEFLQRFEAEPSPLLKGESLRSLYNRRESSRAGVGSTDWLYD